MAKIYYQQDADRSVLDGQSVAVVGYGNQGRSWALNLRDSGVDVSVCVRSDETREKAEADGFTTHDLEYASEADILCVLIPDDIIPSLPITPKADALTIVASGYTVAFDRFDPAGDIGMYPWPLPDESCAEHDCPIMAVARRMPMKSCAWFGR